MDFQIEKIAKVYESEMFTWLVDVESIDFLRELTQEFRTDTNNIGWRFPPALVLHVPTRLNDLACERDDFDDDEDRDMHQRVMTMLREADAQGISWIIVEGE